MRVNVLVTPQGHLRLVDYDAMFVPSLQGKRSHEVGHGNYQHPARTAEDFDDRLDCSKSAEGDSGGTRPVGSFPSGASPSGVLDMAGNVWQWCSDWYDSRFYSTSLATQRNPENQSFGPKSYRVLRGGSWYFYDPLLFRSAYRDLDAPNGRYSSGVVGFRCVSGL